jgi:uncharacterized protein (DUF2235 family)
MQDLFESEKSSELLPKPLEPRQLVILCDGTSNTVDAQGGTNVFKLLSALPKNSTQTKTFYDPGVGSPAYAPATTWWDQLKQMAERIKGLAFGNGVFENIAQAYEFLIKEYQDGNQIYVFGFSRGAFTARSVVGMVNAFGLLPAHSAHLIPTLMNIYFTSKSPDIFTQTGRLLLKKMKLNHEENEDTTRGALIKKVRSDLITLDRRNIQVRFVGVWDTVATIGIPPLDRQIPVNASMKEDIFDAQGKKIGQEAKKFLHVRQALALDEQRVMFQPRQYQEADVQYDPAQPSQQSLVQRWFAGAHSDVGGTYKDNSVISTSAIAWLLKEASLCGLRMDLRVLQAVSAPANPSTQTKPLIHSALYDTPYWAAAGMCVREARYGAAMDMPALSYPQDTVWKNRRSGKLWLAAAFFSALFFWASGWAALGFGREQLFQLQAWQDALLAPTRMALWQLQAVVGDCNPNTFSEHANLKTAVLWDTLMIVAYAYIAGRLLSRAFASLAGLNAFQAKPRRMLNVLGLGLMALVIGDLLENIATFIWLAWPAGTWPLLLGTTAVFVTLFSIVKLVGLAMCIALAVWAAWRARSNS